MKSLKIKAENSDNNVMQRFLKASILLLAAFAFLGQAAALDINSSTSLRYFPDTGPKEFAVDTDGNLNMTGDNITNFFNQTQCAEDEAVKNVYPNGSYQCVGISEDQAAEGLSETLAVNNTANQSIDMNGNAVSGVSDISAPEGSSLQISTDGNTLTQNAEYGYTLTTGSSVGVAESRLEVSGVVNTATIDILNSNLDLNDNKIQNFFNQTQCASDEAIKRINPDGSYECNSINTTTEAEGLSETLAAGNLANQTIEFEANTALGIGNSNTDTNHGEDIAIGKGADATFTTAMGNPVSAIAIGHDAESLAAAGSPGGVALGHGAKANSAGATAVGMGSKVTIGSFASAFGNNAEANRQGAVAIGYSANAPNQYEATFGNLQGQELDVNVTGNLTVHGGRIDFQNGSIENFFDQGQCSSGKVVQRVYANGSYKCVSVDSISGVENLSATLAEGNSAGDYSINLSSNSLQSVDNITFNRSVLLGEGTSGNDGRDVVIGPEAVAEASNTGHGETAVGYNSTAALYASSFGSNSDAAGGGVSIGHNTTAGQAAVTLGTSSNSTNAAMAVGPLSSASGLYSSAIGAQASASKEGAVAIGYGANAPNKYEATFGNLNTERLDVNVTGNLTVHGDQLNFTGSDSTIMYPESNVRIGEGASTGASLANTVAIGRDARSSSVAVGYNSESYGVISTAVGLDARSQVSAVALGGYSDATGGAVALGADVDSDGVGANASGVRSVALGPDSSTSAEGAVAIGDRTNVSSPYTARFGNLDGQELDVNITGNATVYGKELDLRNGSITNFFNEGQCAPDRAVKSIYENGTYRCTAVVESGVSDIAKSSGLNFTVVDWKVKSDSEESDIGQGGLDSHHITFEMKSEFEGNFSARAMKPSNGFNTSGQVRIWNTTNDGKQNDTVIYNTSVDKGDKWANFTGIKLNDTEIYRIESPNGAYFSAPSEYPEGAVYSDVLASSSTMSDYTIEDRLIELGLTDVKWLYGFSRFKFSPRNPFILKEGDSMLGNLSLNEYSLREVDKLEVNDIDSNEGEAVKVDDNLTIEGDLDLKNGSITNFFNQTQCQNSYVVSGINPNGSYECISADSAVTSQSLETTLEAGTSAGSYSIDMNENSVNNIYSLSGTDGKIRLQDDLDLGSNQLIVGNSSISGGLKIGSDINLQGNDLLKVGFLNPGGSSTNFGGDLNVGTDAITAVDRIEASQGIAIGDEDTFTGSKETVESSTFNVDTSTEWRNNGSGTNTIIEDSNLKLETVGDTAESLWNSSLSGSGNDVTTGQGNIYTVTGNNELVKYDGTGTEVWNEELPGAGYAVDFRDGEVFVVGGSYVLKYVDNGGSTSQTWNKSLGNSGFDIAVENNTVYVTDQSGNIEKYIDNGSNVSSRVWNTSVSGYVNGPDIAAENNSIYVTRYEAARFDKFSDNGDTVSNEYSIQMVSDSFIEYDEQPVDIAVEGDRVYLSIWEGSEGDTAKLFKYLDEGDTASSQWETSTTARAGPIDVVDDELYVGYGSGNTAQQLAKFVDNGGSVSQAWTIGTPGYVNGVAYMDGAVYTASYSDDMLSAYENIETFAETASYTSSVIDAGSNVEFPSLEARGFLPSGTKVNITVEVSDSQDMSNSNSTKLEFGGGTETERIGKNGRYARFDISIASDRSDTPELDEVAINYGSAAEEYGFNQIAIGNSAQTTKSGAVAIGHNASSNESYTARFGNSQGQELDVDVTGNLSADRAAFGSNKISGLSEGDINASNIYYDTMTAKSPVVQCSQGSQWCKVDIPENQSSFFVKKGEDFNKERPRATAVEVVESDVETVERFEELEKENRKQEEKIEKLNSTVQALKSVVCEDNPGAEVCQ